MDASSLQTATGVTVVFDALWERVSRSPALPEQTVVSVLWNEHDQFVINDKPSKEGVKLACAVQKIADGTLEEVFSAEALDEEHKTRVKKALLTLHQALMATEGGGFVANLVRKHRACTIKRLLQRKFWIDLEEGEPPAKLSQLHCYLILEPDGRLHSLSFKRGSRLKSRKKLYGTLRVWPGTDRLEVTTSAKGSSVDYFKAIKEDLAGFGRREISPVRSDVLRYCRPESVTSDLAIVNWLSSPIIAQALPGVLKGKVKSCYVRSISTYPDGLGEPIADCFLVAQYHGRALLAVADGCGWGEQSRHAAHDAVNTFLEKMAGEYGINAQTVAKALDGALQHANQAVKSRRYHGCPTAGSTTFLGGVLCEGPEDGWLFCFVTIGDCKAYIQRKGGEVEDLTAGFRFSTDERVVDGRLGGGEADEMANIHYVVAPCHTGDVLYLMSDGVYDNLGSSNIDDPILRDRARAAQFGALIHDTENIQMAVDSVLVYCEAHANEPGGKPDHTTLLAYEVSSSTKS